MRWFFYEGIDVSTKTFFDETVQRGRRTGLVRGCVCGGGESGRGGSKEVAGQTCGSRWPGFQLFPSWPGCRSLGVDLGTDTVTVLTCFSLIS